MPEPMFLSEGRVGLCWTPAHVSMAIDDVPVIVRNFAFLIPCPANVAIFEKPDIGKDERVRLVGAQLFDDAGKVVDMPGAAGPIEPELLKRSVSLSQFIEL